MSDQPQSGIGERTSLTPGYKTTEFWTTLAAGGVLPFLVGNLPPTWQAGIATVAAAAYSISRGIAKLGVWWRR